MAGIELNADVGEGGRDEMLFPYVHRVSIACGGHAGNAPSMRAALLLSRQHNVIVGAHPGYPDPANFGRVAMHATPEEITHWVLEQSRTLMRIADELSIRLFHVKPHGALYNLAAVDSEVGRAMIAAAKKTGLALLVLAGSPLAARAREAGIAVLEEAFADRRYLNNGSLAPRAVPGAVIDDPQEAAAQAVAIAHGQPVACLNGGTLVLRADTVCLHGDGLRVSEIADAVSRVLK